MVTKRRACDVAVREVRRVYDFSKRTKLLHAFPATRTFDNVLCAVERFTKTVKMVSIKKLGIGGGVSFVFGILLWCGFPALIKSQIKKAIALKPGSEIREMWSAFPLPLDFKIYLFNVTNADEIAQGKKPKLQEVGPFFYDEYKLKFDLVDKEEEDSVEYSMKSWWIFNPSKSGKLTGEEIMVVPHLMILGMVGATLIEKPAAIGVVGKAVDSIFHKPSSIFVTAKAKDILFDGLPIDCTVTDFAGSAVCSLLKEAKDLMPDGENRYKFSLFGGKNNTPVEPRMKVLRGSKNFKDVGRVLEFDGKPALDIWPEDHCNEFNGTDSTIFAPLFGPDDDIVSFGYEICRSLSAHFDKRSKIKGINTLRYTADLGDMSSNPREKCFCPTPDTCLTKNLYDMTKCVGGVPIIGSLPHFYGGDGTHVKLVDGLNPNQEEHEIAMDFEPMTATPLRAHKRLQFNMFIKPVPKFKLMKNFPECLLPLFWVEEGILLPDEFVDKLKVVFKVLAVVNFLKWLLVLGGVGMGGGAGYLYYKKRDSGKLDITKVTPKAAGGNNNKPEKSWPPGMHINTISASVPSSLDRN